jgi:hypothetical protein
VLSTVADPDLPILGSPIRISVKSNIRIRIKVKAGSGSASKSKFKSCGCSKRSHGGQWTSGMEAWMLKMETWTVCIPVVADWHHLMRSRMQIRIKEIRKEVSGSASRVISKSGFKQCFRSGPAVQMWRQTLPSHSKLFFFLHFFLFFFFFSLLLLVF